MNWKKMGLLCDRNSIHLDWFKLNVMCPTPYLINENILRIYVAFCDSLNRGRVGYLDVDVHNPGEIVGISSRPVLDIGNKGMFDESGVLPTCILQENNKVFMYYCGFQKYINIPYTSFCGLAVSEDNGNSFYRVKETPVLDRIDYELFIRTGAYAKKTANGYSLLYASGSEWFDLDGKKEPIYKLKAISSREKDQFIGCGETVIDLIGDEYGITMPQILTDGSLIFSARTKSRGYHIVHASFDGKRYIRDENDYITISKTGWDSEMICFAKQYSYDNIDYLFYCGNHYGIGGLGWAKRV